MAWYKNPNLLKKSNGDAYDKLYTPGMKVPHSGIYKCEGCGREIAANQTDPFPPQNHHQHTTYQGSIRWRLIVYADHKTAA
jgi:hypothetical protein